MKRTQEEILKRIADRTPEDPLGFEVNIYIAYLTYENAKPYLKDEITKEDWDSDYEHPTDRMRSYLGFAWEKANGRRGISANRSIMHYGAWMWLIGEDKFAEELLSFEGYRCYGKPQLKKICGYLGLEYQKYDDGEWVD
jgi:hypothetical protein